MSDSWIVLASLIWVYLFVVFSTRLVAAVGQAHRTPIWARRVSGNIGEGQGAARIGHLVFAVILAIGPQVVAVSALLMRRYEIGMWGTVALFAELSTCVAWSLLLLFRPRTTR